jgi:AbiV family abortive infection protein
MRARAIKDLSQLSDTSFFLEAAEGPEHIISNARRLCDSAVVLAEAKHGHGYRVLMTLSEEEASKFLILIDAVRCPRQPADRFSNQLSRFKDHLAKGLYAQSCSMRPASLAQLQEYLDHYREDLYLDGPNDVDWIFRNQIIRGREEILYVDYVAHEDSHSWLHPGPYNESSFFYCNTDKPGALRIVDLLYNVGLSKANALAEIADLWRPAAIGSEMPWQELRDLNHKTLERLDSKGLLQERSQREYESLVDWWQFPLYSLDMSLLKVNIELLREKQRNWSPG